MSWSDIKRRQANEADTLAAVASGIGEYGVANACYKLAGRLRREAQEIKDRDAVTPEDDDENWAGKGFDKKYEGDEDD